SSGTTSTRLFTAIAATSRSVNSSSPPDSANTTSSASYTIAWAYCRNSNTRVAQRGRKHGRQQAAQAGRTGERGVRPRRAQRRREDHQHRRGQAEVGGAEQDVDVLLD